MGKLINIGSLCIDRVYKVPKIATQGETVTSLSWDTFSGGKGLNQSIAAAKAGALVEHVGCIGSDGDSLIAELGKAGIASRFVKVGVAPSGHAVIQVDEDGRNSIVISAGANRELDSELIQDAILRLEDNDWLLLQNETNGIAEAIELAAQEGKKVAINLAPADKRMFDYPLSKVALIIVNELEAMALSSKPSPQLAFDWLINAYPKIDIVLTLGEEGVWSYRAKDSARKGMGSFNIDATDETAAGDSFIGFLMAMLVAGRDLHESITLASAAGALATTKAGAVDSIPSLDAVKILAGEQDLKTLDL